jgi:hypothetical protein
MTDIKTALSQAMSDWDEAIAPPKAHLFKTTNNVTRSTFNAVRDTPGCTRKAILFGLERQGYKLASTTSILSQMIKQRLVREEDDGTLYANFKEYVPLKGTSKPKVKAKVKVQAKLKAAPIETVLIEAAPQPQATGVTKVQSAWSNKRRDVDIEEWLSEVPLMQAHMVYVRLRQIFEGESK